MTQLTEETPNVDQNRMIILSLRPQYAVAILTGSKTVELRRTKPNIVVPTRALIYAISPTKALVGTCIVETVTSEDVSSIWRRFGSATGVEHGEFLRYFEGVSVGTALTLLSPETFSRQIALRDLRAKTQGFRPPRSFAYVDTKAGEKLLQLAA